MGGGGTAVAGTAAAIGGGALAPILNDLTAALAQLQSVLQQIPVTGGGAPTGVVQSGCPCGSGATTTEAPIQATPGQAPTQEPAPAPTPAPEQAPPPPPPASIEINHWLKGDLDGLDGELTQRLAKIGERLGQKLTIASGKRSREEQQELYDLYLAGKGNLAAKPGTSNHETGRAADVNVDGTSLANYKNAKDVSAEFGIHFPVGGEPWHAEMK